MGSAISHFSAKDRVRLCFCAGDNRPSTASTSRIGEFHVGAQYDQRLVKCVGVSVATDTGPWLSVEWCYVEFPWSQDFEMDQRLKANYPFRAVKQAQLRPYSFDDTSAPSLLSRQMFSNIGRGGQGLGRRTKAASMEEDL